jgi:DNA polymerase-4/protein ImuB
MSYACLAVPSLALAQALLERPDLRGRPVALVDESGVRVSDATSEAARRGVRAGMTVREAVAYCPRLAVLEQRPARLRRVAEQLLEAASTVSPLIEEAEPGVVFADLRGLESLYPRPGEIEGALLASAPAGLQPRVGIAGQRFTAHVAALSAPPGEALRVDVEESAAFLGSRPAEWLPLDAETLRQLRLLGIHTIGEYAALPGHAVQAQFGALGRRAWLAARGQDPEPVRPRPFAIERVIEHAQAQPPLISREAILLGARQLLRRALRQPRAAGRFVRMLRLWAVTEEGQVWERNHTLREPANDEFRLWTVVNSQFEYSELPGPIAELELELGGLTAETGRQPGLFIDHTRRREQLEEMVRHLRVRFGHSPMAQVVEVEPWSRLPERRYALMDYEP